MKQTIAIKEWFYDKTEDASKKFNCFINLMKNENGIRLVKDGFVYVTGEVLKESEKAIQVKLETGAVVGSVNGWTTWIPKSVIA